MPEAGNRSVLGEYDETGCPCINFHICGVKHDVPGLEYSGIVDTGFSGFLQVPLSVALSLGLPLEGTGASVLADGKTETHLTALGKVTLAGETLVGLVSIAPDDASILIGMDFLRVFQKNLLIGKDIVFLPDARGSDEE